MSHNKWQHFDSCIFRIQFSELEELKDSTPFIVSDESGGQKILDSYGDSKSNYKYNFKSIGFNNNLSKVIQKEKISHVRPTPIPSIKGTNQVSLRASRHEKFEPITKSNVNIFSFEKSVFQAVSRDMLNFLSGVKSFNNLIGEPVNKYRKNYKLLDHVRERYFSNVLNEPDFERYMNYYKWIDSAIGTLLGQMVPASAFSNVGIEDVVESHALERSKYDHKYFRVERKEPNLEANLLAINELLYDWEHGHVSDNEDEHCLWQKDRKIRINDPERENIRKVLTTKVLPTLGGPGKDYVLRNLVKPYKHSTDEQPYIEIGHNRNANKIKGLYKIINTGKEITIDSDQFYEFKKCDDIIDPQRDRLYTAKTNTSDTDGYLDADADLILPFSFYSSSVGVDFENFKDKLKITNNIELPEAIHSNVSYYFGHGPQHRNVKIGTPSENRPEAYEISASSDVMTIKQNTSGPRSIYHRGLLGNRLYNTSNIKTKLSDEGVIVLGNYEKDYEIVMTNGRLQNNNYLVENEGKNLTGSLAHSSYVVGMLNHEVPERTKREHVIVNRFSAIGSPETSAKAFLDRDSEEYSIYNTVNYRNLIARGIYNMLCKEGSSKFGYRAPHGSPISLTGSIHKTNRNYNRFISRGVPDDHRSDNFFITHQIPQNDFGYSWITASAGPASEESILSFMHKNGGIGHQHHFEISGSLKSSETISFLTEGEHFIASGQKNDEIILFGESQYSLNEVGHVGDKVSFNNLNLRIAEPVDPETNFMGANSLFPFGFIVGDNDPVSYIQENTPIFNPYTFRNQEMFDSQQVMSSIANAGPIMFNSMILNRQGPYGWPSWKQVRTSQHPIVRNHRKNNTISATFRGVSPFPSCLPGVRFEYDNTMENHNIVNGLRTIKNYKEILATSKFNPITVTRHMLHTIAGNDFFLFTDSQRIPDQVPQWALALMWWNDEFLHEFVTRTQSISDVMQLPSLSMRVPLQNTVTGFANQDMADDIRYEERSILNTSNIETINTFLRTESAVQGATFMEINYIETVYPREINTFTKHARERELFDFFGWDSDRENRSLILGPFGISNIRYPGVGVLPSFLHRGPNLWRYLPELSGDPAPLEENFETSLFNSYEMIDFIALVDPANPETFGADAAVQHMLQTSKWVLDARKDYSQLPTTLLQQRSQYAVKSTGPGSLKERSEYQTGLLQNEFSIFPMGGNAIRGGAPFAPVYNRRIPQAIETSDPAFATNTNTDTSDTEAIYNLGASQALIASDPADNYAPFKLSQNGTILDNERFDIAAAIKTTSVFSAVAYKVLSSVDLFFFDHATDPPDEISDAESVLIARGTQGGQLPCLGSIYMGAGDANYQPWSPAALPFANFPTEYSLSSRPELGGLQSVEIVNGANDQINQISEVQEGESVYLSFSELRLNVDEIFDWTIEQAEDVFGPKSIFDGPKEDEDWLATPGGRIETRKYRNGKAVLYKANLAEKSGFQVLAEYDVPLLVLRADWDAILENMAFMAGEGGATTAPTVGIDVGGLFNFNFITLHAELSLISDKTSENSATPNPDAPMVTDPDGGKEMLKHVILSSSTMPLANTFRIYEGSDSCDQEDKLPYAVYVTELESNNAVNTINLLDPSQETLSSVEVLSGEAVWEAADSTEIGPFYDEYIDFAEEARLVGQQYSLVSEFTISKFIEDIYASGTISSAEVGDDFLQLTGAVYHSSSGDISIGTQFFKTYSNSDFMKYFQPFRKNITENGFGLAEGKLTMRCQAVKRILPYRGFYPAERSVQISEIFHRNYLKEDSFRAEYIPNNLIPESDSHYYLRMKVNNLKAKIAKPLLMPGVLYNSIKTGLAVDYPLFRNTLPSLGTARLGKYMESNDFYFEPEDVGVGLIHQDDLLLIPYTGSKINNTEDAGIPRLSGSVDRRVTFEDMLSPIRLLGQTIYENEPHHKASTLFGNSINYRVQEDQPRFGVIDDEATKLSIGMDVDQNWQATARSFLPYTSAIHNFTSETVKFFLQDEKLQTLVSRPSRPLLQQGVNYVMRVYVNNLNTVMYDRHSAFGPPVDDGNPTMSRYVWAPDTGSIAHADITFEPEAQTFHDLLPGSFQAIIDVDDRGLTSVRVGSEWQNSNFNFQGTKPPDEFTLPALLETLTLDDQVPFFVFNDPAQYAVPVFKIRFSDPLFTGKAGVGQSQQDFGDIGPMITFSYEIDDIGAHRGLMGGSTKITFYNKLTTVLINNLNDPVEQQNGAHLRSNDRRYVNTVEYFTTDENGNDLVGNPDLVWPDVNDVVVFRPGDGPIPHLNKPGLTPTQKAEKVARSFMRLFDPNEEEGQLLLGHEPAPSFLARNFHTELHVDEDSELVEVYVIGRMPASSKVSLTAKDFLNVGLDVPFENTDNFQTYADGVFDSGNPDERIRGTHQNPLGLLYISCLETGTTRLDPDNNFNQVFSTDPREDGIYGFHTEQTRPNSFLKQALTALGHSDPSTWLSLSQGYPDTIPIKYIEVVPGDGTATALNTATAINEIATNPNFSAVAEFQAESNNNSVRISRKTGGEWSNGNEIGGVSLTGRLIINDSSPELIAQNGIENFQGGADARDLPSLQKEQFIKSGSHGFLPYVAPFLDPDTAPYAQLVFTPGQTREYTIPEILNDLEISYFNMPSPDNAAENTNFQEAMVLSASINLKNSVLLYSDNHVHLGPTPGKVNVVNNPDPTLYRWVIQPKWETPILNFKEEEVSTLNLSNSQVEKTQGSVWKNRYQTDYYTESPSSSVPYLTSSTGMWHQRGKPAVLEPNEGYYLTVVGPGVSTGKTTTGDLAEMVGFTNEFRPSFKTTADGDYTIPTEANLFRSAELGRIAEEKIISEAVVAIPYCLTEDCDIKFFNMRKDVYERAIEINKLARDEFVNHMRIARTPQEADNIKEEYDRFFESTGLKAPVSAAYQIRMMDKYIMPPQFDFNRNPKIDPYVAYIFQFKAKLSRQDLADIWQNLYPTSKKSVSVTQHSTVLGDDLECDIEYITHMLGNANTPFTKGATSLYEEPDKLIESDIRWLVFKIKYRAEGYYGNVIEDSITNYRENIMELSTTRAFGSVDEFKDTKSEKEIFKNYSYNWPYDYFSMVEMIKLESKVDFNSHAQDIRTATNTQEATEQDPADSGAIDFDTFGASVLTKIVSGQTLKGNLDPIPTIPTTVEIPLAAGEQIRQGSETVFLNGVLQQAGATSDYVISGNKIIFANNLTLNDNVQVSFIKI